MKKLSILILVLPMLMMISCNDNGKTDQASNENAMVQDQNIDSDGQGQELASIGPVYLNKSAFLTRVHDFESTSDWSFAGDKPVIVDFYADWCKPCKMVAPFLEELAVKYQDQVDVYKVNVDMEQEIAAYYKISSIPTFFFVDSDGEVSVDLGYKPKEYFEQRILTMIGETNEATVN